MKPIEGRYGDLEGAALTHPGRVRRHNEDTFVFDLERGRFAVIDGMGGQNAGEVAAAITRDALLEPGSLAIAFAEANRRIRADAEHNPEREGMGCVATAVQRDERDGAQLSIAHVGDTRAVLANADGCVQLTRDHTRAAEAQAEQGIPDREALRGPGRNVVFRDIGGERREGTDWIDRVQGFLDPRDVLLLCSDGLSDLVPAAELLGRVADSRAQRTSMAALVVDLVELALGRGAPDNVTVVAVRRRHRLFQRRRWT